MGCLQVDGGTYLKDERGRGSNIVACIPRFHSISFVESIVSCCSL